MGNQPSNGSSGDQSARSGAAASASGEYQQTQANGTGTAVQARKPAGTKVLLNVYEPAGGGGGLPGFKVYHTGIEFSGVEYSFAGAPDAGAGTGVMSQQPRATPADGQWKFMETIELGTVTVSNSDFDRTLRNLQDQFPANTYDLLHRNCNVFTKTVAEHLGVAKAYPSWINRAANWGKVFVAPPKHLKDIEAPKAAVSVFKSTTGHRLDGGKVEPKKADVKAAAAAAGKPAEKKSEQKAAPVAAAGGSASKGSGRKNPWAEPGFLPPSSRKDAVILTGKTDA